MTATVRVPVSSQPRAHLCHESKNWRRDNSAGLVLRLRASLCTQSPRRQRVRRCGAHAFRYAPLVSAEKTLPRNQALVHRVEARRFPRRARDAVQPAAGARRETRRGADSSPRPFGAPRAQPRRRPRRGRAAGFLGGPRLSDRDGQDRQRRRPPGEPPTAGSSLGPVLCAAHTDRAGHGCATGLVHDGVLGHDILAQVQRMEGSLRAHRSPRVPHYRVLLARRSLLHVQAGRCVAPG